MRWYRGSIRRKRKTLIRGRGVKVEKDGKFEVAGTARVRMCVCAMNREKERGGDRWSEKDNRRRQR